MQRWMVVLMGVAVFSGPGHAAGGRSDPSLAYWCDGSPVEHLPPVPSVPKGEINLPASNELTLLGTLGVRMLNFATLRGVSEAGLEGGAFTPEAIKETARFEREREATYKQRMAELMPEIALPRRSDATDDDTALTAPGGWLAQTNSAMSGQRNAQLTAIGRLLDAGANPDAPLLGTVCATPRDFLLRARRELPGDERLAALVKRLPAEPVPPNDAGRAFRETESTVDALSRRTRAGASSALSATDLMPQLPAVMRTCTAAPRTSELGMRARELLQAAIFESMTQGALAGARRRQNEAPKRSSVAERARAADRAAEHPAARGADAAPDWVDEHSAASVAAGEWLEKTRKATTEEIRASVSAARQLLAAGADPDAPMVEDLCITPRDLFVRATREYPQAQEIRDLLARLPPERVRPNALGNAFLSRPGSVQTMKNIPGARPELVVTPAMVVESVAGAMRQCKPPSQRLSLCERAQIRAPVVRSGRVKPAAPYDAQAAQRTTGWWASLQKDFAGNADRLRYRADGKCWRANAQAPADCAAWFPLAALVGDSFAGKPYQTRSGGFPLASADKLPDGYHLIGEPPALYAIRSGVVTLDSVATDLPAAFVWPEAARHRTAIANPAQEYDWLIEHFNGVLRNLPSVVNVSILQDFTCARACQLTLSTELVAAAADWKHHLRPLLIDAMFAIVTPVGDYVDSNYATVASHMRDHVAAAARRDPGVENWNLQPYDGFVRSLGTRSIIASGRMPFIGFTYLPRYDKGARDPKFARGGLNGDWMSYPIDCAVHRALHPDRVNRNASCSQYALPLRLSVGAATLPSGVVARTVGRQVILARDICFVDGRNAVVPGWSAACTAGARRVPLADVFRHELGHWLGVEHVADDGAGDETDIMIPALGGSMSFTQRSRTAARERVGDETIEFLRINEDLRLW